MGNLLHHHRFTGFGLRHEQGALAFTYRGDQVDDTPSDVVIGFDLTFKPEGLFGKERCQVFKMILCLFSSGVRPLTRSTFTSAK